MSFISNSPAGGLRVNLHAFADTRIEVMPVGDGSQVIGLGVAIPSPNSATITLSEPQARELLRRLSCVLDPLPDGNVTPR